MERTKKNNQNIYSIEGVSAILCGDIHLREDVPICRTDDFWATQWKKIDFISDLQKQCNCPVLCSGDLFDYWKPSPNLLSMASEHLPDQFYSIYGQHDLPQHSMELNYKSGLYNLWKNGKVTILDGNCTNDSDYPFLVEGCSFGAIPSKEGIKRAAVNILVWHKMFYQGKLPWPGCTDPLGAGLLRKYPQYSLICTGDNHKPFVEEYQGRILVNVGSMMRTTADQTDFRPRVWLWYAETNTVVPVYLPIEEGVISREHLEVQEQRENRIDAFISRLNTDWKASLSFEENLEIFKAENQVRKSVMDILYKSLE
ncbi:MAG: metallophosphoesterase [Candidatus Paceibacterota bacterium]|jgi:predicted phosphodiesterase